MIQTKQEKKKKGIGSTIDPYKNNRGVISLENTALTPNQPFNIDQLFTCTHPIFDPK